MSRWAVRIPNRTQLTNVQRRVQPRILLSQWLHLCDCSALWWCLVLLSLRVGCSCERDRRLLQRWWLRCPGSHTDPPHQRTHAHTHSHARGRLSSRYLNSFVRQSLLYVDCVLVTRFLSCVSSAKHRSRSASPGRTASAVSRFCVPWADTVTLLVPLSVVAPRAVSVPRGTSVPSAPHLPPRESASLEHTALLETPRLPSCVPLAGTVGTRH